ncbi:MAG: hypothetical protein KDJ86_04440, partial [Bauldia sp.]|uniref:hypothetical protein n=1 Tax=Bauldia sp. TaxID=2575872 RepID=UPI001E1AAFB0
AGGDNISKAMTTLEAEKSELASRLAALEEDHANLRAENAELRRTAGAEWEEERAADQRLRERLSELASNVVRLARNTESGSPGPSVPAPPVRAENSNGEHAGNGIERTGMPDDEARQPDARPKPPEAARPLAGRSLAERIRALQHAPARQEAETVRDL